MKKHCEYVRKHGKLKKVEDMEIELNLSEFEDLPEIHENLEENSCSKDWFEKEMVHGPNFLISALCFATSESHFRSRKCLKKVRYYVLEMHRKFTFSPKSYFESGSKDFWQKYTFEQFESGPKLHFGTWSEISEMKKVSSFVPLSNCSNVWKF